MNRRRFLFASLGSVAAGAALVLRGKPETPAPPPAPEPEFIVGSKDWTAFVAQGIWPKGVFYQEPEVSLEAEAPAFRLEGGVKPVPFSHTAFLIGRDLHGVKRSFAVQTIGTEMEYDDET
jgi:hypothetical protein